MNLYSSFDRAIADKTHQSNNPLTPVSLFKNNLLLNVRQLFVVKTSFDLY